jgi:L-fuconate dehydratase
MKITNFSVRDIRFPTAKEKDGSDALNLGNYSATYVTLETDGGLKGYGLTFTNGRGNEASVLAAKAYLDLVKGATLEEITADFRGFYHKLAQDPQLRWVGPERGLVHMAFGAVINAIWDLWARRERKPLWKLLADLTPEQVVSAIDFTWITDTLTPGEALAILKKHAPTKAQREEEMRKNGYPAYTTSTGWLGYPDEKVKRLCREAKAQGWRHFKMKVAMDLEANLKRAALMRGEIGDDCFLMMDANQCWDVEEAIRQTKALARFNPWWMEEPTCPDDVLGHAAIAKAVAPIPIATGEACQNRVVFKQFLQAGGLSVLQVDSCRVGGVNEVLAILLMAAKYGVRVCPHAGGVGLCEYVQHLAIFGYIAVDPTLENRVCEYVDHLHEHFVEPVKIIHDATSSPHGGPCYAAPLAPGYSIEMKARSLDEYEFPQGKVWKI